jgi:hypothetical protein
VNHRDRYQVMFGAEISKADHPSLAIAAERAFGDLLEAITSCQEGGIVHRRDPRAIAGPLWSLVHGVASLAIGGELRAVGIQADPEVMIEGVVAQLL